MTGEGTGGVSGASGAATGHGDGGATGDAAGGMGPLFLTGLDRTGKTPLRLLLDAHPSLSLTRRTGLWTSTGPVGSDGILSEREAARLVRGLVARPAIAALVPDPDALLAALLAGPPTRLRLAELVHERHAGRRGRRRWGDQDAALERYAARVMAALPDARVLHLVRDPRDRYADIVAVEGRRPGGAGSASAAWLASVDRAERNARTWPDRYRVIRFEDLALRPGATVHAIGAFIGEPSLPALLDPGPGERDGATDSGTVIRALPDGVGRFRRTLTDTEVAVIQALVGHRMEALGYRRERPGRAVASGLRVVVDWPLALAHFLAWRARDGGLRVALPAGRGGSSSD